ncbi:hypothetical protein YC2023_110441 [Brassica napus]
MSLVRSCTDGEACGRNNHTRFFSSKVSWWLLILGLGEEANQSRVSIEMKEKIDVNKNTKMDHVSNLPKELRSELVINIVFLKRLIGHRSKYLTIVSIEPAAISIPTDFGLERTRKLDFFNNNGA